MSDILSQDEVYALLNAVQDPIDDEESEEQGEEIPFPRNIDLCFTNEQVNLLYRKGVADRVYPSNFCKDEIRQIMYVAEEMAEDAGKELSKLLDKDVDVELVSIDELMMSEFVMSCSNPFSARYFTLPRIKQYGMMEMNLSLLNYLSGENVESMNDRFTDDKIEKFDTVMDVFLYQLKDKFACIPVNSGSKGLFTKGEKFLTNPVRVHKEMFSDPILLASFEIRVGPAFSGLISIVLSKKIVDFLLLTQQDVKRVRDSIRTEIREECTKCKLLRELLKDEKLFPQFKGKRFEENEWN